MREPMDNDEMAAIEGNPVEVKKELFYDDDGDDDCHISNDGIFEVIPFMAKLLSNLKCSFCTRNNAIIISNIELVNINELLARLIKNRINPSRMDCSGASEGSSFSLFIGADQFSKSSPNPHFNKSNPNIAARFLAHMAIATEGTGLSIHIDKADLIHIRAITYDNLASLMVRLKQFDIRPKQVDSLSNSLFSLVFTEESFANSWHALKCYGNQGNPAVDVVNIRRPRICPNYLRDYVVENKEETVTGGVDLMTMTTVLSRSSPTVLEQQFSSLDESAADWADSSSPVVKRGRGRPRIKPRPAELSLDSNQIKKPRGRPRRSDIVPNIIAARTNSFINIQPKSLSAQELENCFAKFLESENLCHAK